jgi:beta-lactamase class A
MSFLRSRWGIGITALGIGFVAGLLLPSPLSSAVNKLGGHEEREVEHSYTFISPLLACADDNFTNLANDKTNALDRNLNELIQKQKIAGAISEGAVYFRELNGGPWVGVNFETEFTPGSLLKVPLAISVYERAQEDPSLLSKKIEYEGGIAPGEEYFTAPVIPPGVYDVEDLVKATLVNSDNNAATLLAQIIGGDALLESYFHLGVETPKMGSDYSTSVRTYASFFRILYNATYINRQSSEHLLSVLSQSTFTQGIVAGVPSGVVVAHKFGERALEGSSGAQLHDCGIIYRPGNPYLLCVMLRGTNFDTLANSIKDISSLVYSYVK